MVAFPFVGDLHQIDLYISEIRLVDGEKKFHCISLSLSGRNVYEGLTPVADLPISELSGRLGSLTLKGSRAEPPTNYPLHLPPHVNLKKYTLQVAARYEFPNFE